MMLLFKINNEAGDSGGVRGQKHMLILFERFNRCGVKACRMSEFCSVQKLSAFQCVGPSTFL